MIQDFFSSGPLNFIYALIVILSFIFALISLLGAEIGDVLDLDVDGDTDVDFVNISPFALAMFGAAFGLIGLITRLALEMDPLPSLFWATISGLAIGGAAQALFIYVLSPSKSSHYSLSEDATGREAEVIITVPPDGLGQITFDNVSGRVTLGARSAMGKQIHRGEYVQIIKVTGRIALVQPLDESKSNLQEILK